jgi:hypothetical protein
MKRRNQEKTLGKVPVRNKEIAIPNNINVREEKE